jgi:hypothetical protein
MVQARCQMHNTMKDRVVRDGAGSGFGYWAETRLAVGREEAPERHALWLSLRWRWRVECTAYFKFALAVDRQSVHVQCAFVSVRVDVLIGNALTTEFNLDRGGQHKQASFTRVPFLNQKYSVCVLLYFKRIPAVFQSVSKHAYFYEYFDRILTAYSSYLCIFAYLSVSYLNDRRSLALCHLPCVSL